MARLLLLLLLSAAGAQVPPRSTGDGAQTTTATQAN
jgi:hypothetical protein